MAEHGVTPVGGLFAQKHGEFRGYRIGVIRLGTYRTHISFLYCGALCCFGVSLFGRRWSTPDIQWKARG